MSKILKKVRFNIFTSFVTLLVITVSATTWYMHSSNTKAFLKLSEELMGHVTKLVIEKTVNYLEPAAITAEMGSRIIRDQKLNLTANPGLESLATEILTTYPQLAMYNIGDEKGNFLMPKRKPNGTISTKIINRNIKPATVAWIHRNAQGKVIEIDKSTNVKFDPRQRPWYKGAKTLMGTYWTGIYIFFTDQVPGITASYPIISSKGKFLGVIGLDIELGEVSNFLKSLKISKNARVMIVNDKKEVIAYPDISKISKIEDGKYRPVHINELDVREAAVALYEHEATGKDKFSFALDGKKYIASIADFPETFGKRWKITLVVPQDDFIGVIKKPGRVAFAISLFVLLIAISFTLYLFRSISKPIEQLTAELSKVKDFDLDDGVRIKSSFKEIRNMSAAVAAMKLGLNIFKKYTPTTLVRQLISTGDEASIGGQKRHVSVLFSNIAQFSRISETMPPDDLMLHLSKYHELFTKIVTDNSGVVDKNIGGAIMAFWGAPIKNDTHGLNACRAALAFRQQVNDLNAKREEEGKLPTPIRIGIHTGESIVGNIGSNQRMSYSVLGDTFNFTGRLEGINKIFGTQIIVSHNVFEKVSDEFLLRPLDTITVRNNKKQTMIYELVNEKTGDLGPYTLEFYEQYLKAFKAYTRHDWDEAILIFNDLLLNFPLDKTTKVYVERCLWLKQNPTSKYRVPRL
ncbi:cache domain-containing protein [Elusimicrobiota bacterium]